MGIARDGMDEKSETKRNAGGGKGGKYPEISDNTFPQLPKSVGEPMLERIWAA